MGGEIRNSGRQPTNLVLRPSGETSGGTEAAENTKPGSVLCESLALLDDLVSELAKWGDSLTRIHLTSERNELVDAVRAYQENDTMPMKLHALNRCKEMGKTVTVLAKDLSLNQRMAEAERERLKVMLFAVLVVTVLLGTLVFLGWLACRSGKPSHYLTFAADAVAFAFVAGCTAIGLKDPIQRHWSTRNGQQLVEKRLAEAAEKDAAAIQITYFELLELVGQETAGSKLATLFHEDPDSLLGSAALTAFRLIAETPKVAVEHAMDLAVAADDGTREAGTHLLKKLLLDERDANSDDLAKRAQIKAIVQWYGLSGEADKPDRARYKELVLSIGECTNDSLHRVGPQQQIINRIRTCANWSRARAGKAVATANGIARHVVQVTGPDTAWIPSDLDRVAGALEAFALTQEVSQEAINAAVQEAVRRTPDLPKQVA